MFVVNTWKVSLDRISLCLNIHPDKNCSSWSLPGEGREGEELIISLQEHATQGIIFQIVKYSAQQTHICHPHYPQKKIALISIYSIYRWLSHPLPEPPVWLAKWVVLLTKLKMIHICVFGTNTTWLHFENMKFYLLVLCTEITCFALL